MKGFFDGIGQWAATFGCQDVQAGQVVKFAKEGQVVDCEAGDDFCGFVVSVGRDRSACSVALGGIVTVPFSGSAPGVGWCGLIADGKGGVSAAAAGSGVSTAAEGDASAAAGSGASTTGKGGREYRVIDVDAGRSSVTFVL